MVKTCGRIVCFWVPGVHCNIACDDNGLSALVFDILKAWECQEVGCMLVGIFYMASVWIGSGGRRLAFGMSSFLRFCFLLFLYS